MATLKKTATGKVDKRTKEYKELVERAKLARKAKARAAAKTATKTTAKSTTRKTSTVTKRATTSSVKRRADGKVDLRTKEGKAVAEKMARARAAKDKPTGLKSLLKKLLK